MNLVDISAEFLAAQQVLTNFNTPENMQKIVQGISIMHTALTNGHKIMSCGNGGSMCDAMHFAEELSAMTDLRLLRLLSQTLHTFLV
jgi:D-sedoheptulose 7-phosphate isomerase